MKTVSKFVLAIRSIAVTNGATFRKRGQAIPSLRNFKPLGQIVLASLFLLSISAQAASVTIEMTANEQFISPIKIRKLVATTSHPTRIIYEQEANSKLELRCSDSVSARYCDNIETCYSIQNGTSEILEIEKQEVHVTCGQ